MVFLQKIDQLKSKIDAHRPLNEGEIRELQKLFRVTMTYHSNALEGNSLTEGETKMLIEDGITIGGKTIREIQEALNHAGLVDELFQIAKAEKPIDESFVLNWHQHLLHDIDDANAGKYRQISITVSGSEEVFPKSAQVPNLMSEFFHWLSDGEKKEKHPVEIAATAHWHFVKIHPFVDGNGRMARLLMNLLFLRTGFPPVIIPIVRRSDYLASLRKDLPAFTNFVGETTFENMKDYCRMLEIEF